MKTIWKNGRGIDIFNRVFAVFVIYLFMIAGVNVDVKATGFKNEDGLSGDDYNKEYNNWLSDTASKNPDALDGADWAKVDYNKVEWSKVNDFSNVEAGRIPAEKLSQAVGKIPEDKFKELTSKQLAFGSNLQSVNDLGACSPAAVSEAIQSNYGVTVTVTKGCKMVGDTIYHPSFFSKSHGINLKTLNQDVTLSAVSADDARFAASMVGFVICTKKDSKCTVVASDSSNIDNLNFENGKVNAVVNGESFAVSGQMNALRDSRGNVYLVLDEGSRVVVRDIEITAQGNEKNGMTEIRVENNLLNINGPALLSGRITGEIYYGSISVSFGQNEGDFSVSAEAADIRIFNDRFSGSFSTDYSINNLIEFTLNKKDSYAIIDNSFLKNEGDEPKRWVTQFSPLAKTMQQVWHNKAMSSTYGKYLEIVNDAKTGKTALDLLQKQVDADLASYNSQLKLAKTDAEKEKIQKSIDSLTTFKKEISADGRITVEGITNAIADKITRLEDDSARIMNLNKNTGYIERIDTSLLASQKNLPLNLVILPKESSLGIADGNGKKSDKINIVSKNGYAVFSPPEYTQKEGELNKDGFIYYGALEQGNAELGYTEAKTNKGLITTKYDIDNEGHSSAKISRNSILADNTIEDAGLILVGPFSKEIVNGNVVPTINMLKLDSDGIHAVAYETGEGKSEAVTNPSKIKEITDNFKKVRDYAQGVLQAVGAWTKETETKLKETLGDIYAQDFDENDVMVFLEENAKDFSDKESLSQIIQVNKLRVNKDIISLNELISQGKLGEELNYYAKQAILNVYDSEGQAEKADSVLNDWMKQSANDENLIKIRESREEQRQLSKSTEGLTGKESILELEKIAGEKPGIDIYSRLSDIYAEQGNAEKAQEYAELARKEFTLNLERAELNLQKAGFVSVIDLTQKATEVNQRLAQASFLNKDYASTESASRFNLDIDKTNIDAQRMLSASYTQRQMKDDDVFSWEKFNDENRGDLSLYTESSTDLINAYAANGQYDKVKDQFQELKDSVKEEQPESIKQNMLTAYIEVQKIAISKGDLDTAIEASKESIDFARTSEEKNDLISKYIDLSKAKVDLMIENGMPKEQVDAEIDRVSEELNQLPSSGKTWETRAELYALKEGIKDSDYLSSNNVLSGMYKAAAEFYGLAGEELKSIEAYRKAKNLLESGYGSYSEKKEIDDKIEKILVSFKSSDKVEDKLLLADAYSLLYRNDERDNVLKELIQNGDSQALKAVALSIGKRTDTYDLDTISARELLLNSILSNSKTDSETKRIAENELNRLNSFRVIDTAINKQERLLEIKDEVAGLEEQWLLNKNEKSRLAELQKERDAIETDPDNLYKLLSKTNDPDSRLKILQKIVTFETTHASADAENSYSLLEQELKSNPELRKDLLKLQLSVADRLFAEASAEYGEAKDKVGFFNKMGKKVGWDSPDVARANIEQTELEKARTQLQEVYRGYLNTLSVEEMRDFESGLKAGFKQGSLVSGDAGGKEILSQEYDQYYAELKDVKQSRVLGELIAKNPSLRGKEETSLIVAAKVGKEMMQEYNEEYYDNIQYWTDSLRSYNNGPFGGGNEFDRIAGVPILGGIAMIIKKPTEWIGLTDPSPGQELMKNYETVKAIREFRAKSEYEESLKTASQLENIEDPELRALVGKDVLDYYASSTDAYIESLEAIKEDYEASTSWSDHTKFGANYMGPRNWVTSKLSPENLLLENEEGKKFSLSKNGNFITRTTLIDSAISDLKEAKLAAEEYKSLADSGQPENYPWSTQLAEKLSVDVGYLDQAKENLAPGLIANVVNPWSLAEMTFSSKLISVAGNAVIKSTKTGSTLLKAASNKIGGYDNLFTRTVTAGEKVAGTTTNIVTAPFKLSSYLERAVGLGETTSYMVFEIGYEELVLGGAMQQFTGLDSTRELGADDFLSELPDLAETLYGGKVTSTFTSNMNIMQNIQAGKIVPSLSADYGKVNWIQSDSGKSESAILKDLNLQLDYDAGNIRRKEVGDLVIFENVAEGESLGITNNLAKVSDKGFNVISSDSRIAVEIDGKSEIAQKVEVTAPQTQSIQSNLDNIAETLATTKEYKDIHVDTQNEVVTATRKDKFSGESQKVVYALSPAQTAKQAETQITETVSQVSESEGESSTTISNLATETKSQPAYTFKSGSSYAEARITNADIDNLLFGSAYDIEEYNLIKKYPGRWAEVVRSATLLDSTGTVWQTAVVQTKDMDKVAEELSSQQNLLVEKEGNNVLVKNLVSGRNTIITNNENQISEGEKISINNQNVEIVQTIAPIIQDEQIFVNDEGSPVRVIKAKSEQALDALTSAYEGRIIKPYTQADPTLFVKSGSEIVVYTTNALDGSINDGTQEYNSIENELKENIMSELQKEYPNPNIVAELDSMEEKGILSKAASFIFGSNPSDAAITALASNLADTILYEDTAKTMEILGELGLYQDNEDKSGLQATIDSPVINNYVSRVGTAVIEAINQINEQSIEKAALEQSPIIADIGSYNINDDLVNVISSEYRTRQQKIDLLQMISLNTRPSEGEEPILSAKNFNMLQKALENDKSFALLLQSYGITSENLAFRKAAGGVAMTPGEGDVLDRLQRQEIVAEIQKGLDEFNNEMQEAYDELPESAKPGFLEQWNEGKKRFEDRINSIKNQEETIAEEQPATQNIVYDEKDYDSMTTEEKYYAITLENEVTNLISRGYMKDNGQLVQLIKSSFKDAYKNGEAAVDAIVELGNELQIENKQEQLDLARKILANFNNRLSAPSLDSNPVLDYFHAITDDNPAEALNKITSIIETGKIRQTSSRGITAAWLQQGYGLEGEYILRLSSDHKLNLKSQQETGGLFSWFGNNGDINLDFSKLQVIAKNKESITRLIENLENAEILSQDENSARIIVQGNTISIITQNQFNKESFESVKQKYESLKEEWDSIVHPPEGLTYLEQNSYRRDSKYSRHYELEEEYGFWKGISEKLSQSQTNIDVQKILSSELLPYEQESLPKSNGLSQSDLSKNFEENRREIKRGDIGENVVLYRGTLSTSISDGITDENSVNPEYKGETSTKIYSHINPNLAKTYAEGWTKEYLENTAKEKNADMVDRVVTGIKFGDLFNLMDKGVIEKIEIDRGDVEKTGKSLSDSLEFESIGSGGMEVSKLSISDYLNSPNVNIVIYLKNGEKISAENSKFYKIGESFENEVVAVTNQEKKTDILMPESWSEIKVGDLLVSISGTERKVMAIDASNPDNIKFTFETMKSGTDSVITEERYSSELDIRGMDYVVREKSGEASFFAQNDVVYGAELNGQLYYDFNGIKKAFGDKVTPQQTVDYLYLHEIFHGILTKAKLHTELTKAEEEKLVDLLAKEKSGMLSGWQKLTNFFNLKKIKNIAEDPGINELLKINPFDYSDYKDGKSLNAESNLVEFMYNLMQNENKEVADLAMTNIQGATFYEEDGSKTDVLQALEKGDANFVSEFGSSSKRETQETKGKSAFEKEMGFRFFKYRGLDKYRQTYVEQKTGSSNSKYNLNTRIRPSFNLQSVDRNMEALYSSVDTDRGSAALMLMLAGTEELTPRYYDLLEALINEVNMLYDEEVKANEIAYNALALILSKIVVENREYIPELINLFSSTDEGEKYAAAAVLNKLLELDPNIDLGEISPEKNEGLSNNKETAKPKLFMSVDVNGKEIIYGAEIDGEIYYDFNKIEEVFPGYTRQQAVHYLMLHEVFHRLISRAGLSNGYEEMFVDLLAREKTGMLTPAKERMLSIFRNYMKDIDPTLHEFFDAEPFDYSKDSSDEIGSDGVVRKSSTYAETQLMLFLEKIAASEGMVVTDWVMENINGITFTNKYVADLRAKGAERNLGFLELIKKESKNGHDLTLFNNELNFNLHQFIDENLDELVEEELRESEEKWTDFEKKVLRDRIMTENNFLAISFLDQQYYNKALRGEDAYGNRFDYLKEMPWLAYDFTEPGSFDRWKNAKDYLDERVMEGKRDITLSVIMNLFNTLGNSLTSDMMRKSVEYYPAGEIFGAKISAMPGVIALNQKDLNYLRKFNEETGNHLLIEEHPSTLLNENLKENTFHFEQGENPSEYKVVSVYYKNGGSVVNSLDDLLEWYNNEVNSEFVDPVKLAATFQQQFSLISPFSQYNGRISRLLMDYILQSNGLTPSFLENKLDDVKLMPNEWVNEVRKGVIRSETMLEEKIAETTDKTSRMPDVITDFDETLISSHSALLWFKDHLKRMTKKNLFKGFLTGINIVRAGVSYELGDAAAAFSVFDGYAEKDLDEIVRNLDFNREAMLILKEIKKQKGVDELKVAILTRNNEYIARKFVELNRETLEEEGITIVDVIGNVPSSKDGIYTGGVDKNRVTTGTKKYFIQEGTIVLGDKRETILARDVNYINVNQGFLKKELSETRSELSMIVRNALAKEKVEISLGQKKENLGLMRMGIEKGDFVYPIKGLESMKIEEIKEVLGKFGVSNTMQLDGNEEFDAMLKRGFVLGHGTKKEINGEFDAWHNGIDIMVEAGTPVYSFSDGVVVELEKAKFLPKDRLVKWGNKIYDESMGYGNSVVVRSILPNGQNVYVRYCNMDTKYLPKLGDNLMKGSQIGAVGKSFTVENGGKMSHLHFQITAKADEVTYSYNKEFNELDELNYNPEKVFGLERYNEEIIKNRETLTKLKKLADDSSNNPILQNLLKDAELTASAVGMKPASIIMGPFTQEHVSALRELFKKEGIDMEVFLMENTFFGKDRTELCLYNNKRVLEAMKESKLFTSEEVLYASSNLRNYMIENRQFFAYDHQLGIILGYPLNDIKDFMELREVYNEYKLLGISELDLKKAVTEDNKEIVGSINDADLDLIKKDIAQSEISIRGIERDVYWRSLNKYSEEVEQLVEKYEGLFDMQREIWAIGGTEQSIESSIEQIMARQGALREQNIWDNKDGLPVGHIEDDARLQEMYKDGKALELKDGEDFKVSDKMRYKLVTPEINKLISEISEEWVSELEFRGITVRNNLMITSALRTLSYQQDLIEQGYPAAEKSSHTRGVAFDIAQNYFYPKNTLNPIAWLKRNDKEYSDALKKVLGKYEEEGKVHLIDEANIGAWHVALDPVYYTEIKQILAEEKYLTEESIDAVIDRLVKEIPNARQGYFIEQEITAGKVREEVTPQEDGSAHISDMIIKSFSETTGMDEATLARKIQETTAEDDNCGLGGSIICGSLSIPDSSTYEESVETAVSAVIDETTIDSLIREMERINNEFTNEETLTESLLSNINILKNEYPPVRDSIVGMAGQMNDAQKTAFVRSYLSFESKRKNNAEIYLANTRKGIVIYDTNKLSRLYPSNQDIFDHMVSHEIVESEILDGSIKNSFPGHTVTNLINSIKERKEALKNNDKETWESKLAEIKSGMNKIDQTIKNPPSSVGANQIDYLKSLYVVAGINSRNDMQNVELKAVRESDMDIKVRLILESVPKRVAYDTIAFSIVGSNTLDSMLDSDLENKAREILKSRLEYLKSFKVINDQQYNALLESRGNELMGYIQKIKEDNKIISILQDIRRNNGDMFFDSRLFKWSATNDAQIVQSAVTLLNLGVEKVTIVTDDADIKQMTKTIKESLEGSVIEKGAEINFAASD